MLRRSFRFGLIFGLAAGVIAAVVKAVQGRSSSQPLPASDWTPLPNAEPVVVPPKPTPAPQAPAPATAPPPPAKPPTPPVERAPSPISQLQEGPDAPSPAAPPAAKPAQAPAKKAPAKKAPPKATPAPWVEPVEGACPGTHPIKAKLASKIFHLPGGLNYARTVPDRCYIDAAAAEADGLRQAKR